MRKIIFPYSIYKKKNQTESILHITFFSANRLLIFFRERQNEKEADETFYIILIEEKETLEQRTRDVVTISVIVLENCSQLWQTFDFHPNHLFISLGLVSKRHFIKILGEKVRN